MKRKYGREQYKNLPEDKKCLLIMEKTWIKKKHLIKIIRNSFFFFNNNLGSFFKKEDKDVLEKEFWSYKFTSER